jgi:ABC-type lipoprotein release transport system permease subunit
MNIKLTNKEIGRLLDRSANQLDHNTLDSLKAARLQAIQNQRVYASGWTARDGLLLGHMQLSARMFNWIIAAVVTSLLVINVAYFSRTADRDHSDIDIAILTDDLPVDSYVN